MKKTAAIVRLEKLFDQKQEVTISFEGLRNELEITVRSCIHLVKRLERGGYIEVIRGGNKPNTYRLLKRLV